MKRTKSTHVLYTLEVFIIDGPITSRFAKENPVVSRTIQIRGHQTLQHLHSAIFKAFDREDEHMYQFQFGGKGPHDPNADRYVLPMEMESLFSDDNPTGLVTKTKMASLNLKADDTFGYWFDYGDDWWHQVNVVAIEQNMPVGKYPKMIKCVGVSPPQYAEEA